MAMAMFPASLRLAILMLEQSPNVEALTASVRATCEIMARTSAEAGMWTECASLFEQIFLRRLERTALHEESIRLGNLYGVELRVIAYVGASISPDASLGDVVQLQREALRFLLGTSGPRSSSLRLLLNPLVSSFWTRALSQQRFNFRSPSLVETNVKDAMNQGIEDRAFAVLRAVADGLGVRLTG